MTEYIFVIDKSHVFDNTSYQPDIIQGNDTYSPSTPV